MMSSQYSHLYIFDLWLVLVQSCALNAHLWLECAGCSLEPGLCLTCIREEPGSYVLRLFCNVSQSSVSTDDWDNLLWELLPTSSKMLVFSQLLYTVLITSEISYSPELLLKKWVNNCNPKFWQKGWQVKAANVFWIQVCSGYWQFNLRLVGYKSGRFHYWDEYSKSLTWSLAGYFKK